MRKKPERKVAIVAAAPATMMMAPFQDDTWEIWAMNDIFNLIPRWDRWFQIHGHAACVAHPTLDTFLRGRHGKPVYMRQHYPEFPDSVEFPLRDVLSRFGVPTPDGEINPARGWQNNTVAWMISLALWEGVDRLGLYGVDMAQDTEYAHQKPSCQAMVMCAIGMGVPVHVPLECDLMNVAYLYGFEDPPQHLAKLEARRKELAARKAEADQMVAEGTRRQAFFQGALDDMGYHEQNWT